MAEESVGPARATPVEHAAASRKPEPAAAERLDLEFRKLVRESYKTIAVIKRTRFSRA